MNRQTPLPVQLDKQEETAEANNIKQKQFNEIPTNKQKPSTIYGHRWKLLTQLFFLVNCGAPKYFLLGTANSVPPAHATPLNLSGLSSILRTQQRRIGGDRVRPAEAARCRCQYHVVQAPTTSTLLELCQSKDSSARQDWTALPARTGQEEDR